MINIKNANEIKLMREAGRLTAMAMEAVAQIIEPGISTLDIDNLAEKYIISKGGIPSFKGYAGFPASVCVSINDQVVHGIPAKKKCLREGDIVSIDMGVILDGFQGDMARTFPVGKVAPEALELIAVTEECFNKGFSAAQPGNRVGDIGWAVQSYAEAHGCSVVRELCGHGIGREMHEEPEVLNYGLPGKGIRLTPGMVICIEPMINAGSRRVRTERDGWTVTTLDHSLSSHHENTVAITEDGPVILTVV